MPFRIEQEIGLIRLTMTGTITVDDLRHILTTAAAIEDALPEAPPRLTDLTAVDTIEVTFTDVLALATARRARSFANSFKSAIVVANDVQKGYARMFQTLNDHPMVRIELFNSLQEAEAWLAARP